jgi:hypothetical protein
MDENGDPIEINYDDKPPIGILPRKIWEDEKEETRHQELKQAIIRYIEADKPIKQEWIDEYHDWLPKAPDDFMKPEKKLIRAWFSKQTCLYEVDDINKKLNMVSAIDLPEDTISRTDKDDYIKNICQIGDGASEYWFHMEPGATGADIAKYIDNKLLPNRKCLFFYKRSSNNHHELERVYFDHHDPGFEVVKQQSNKP